MSKTDDNTAPCNLPKEEQTRIAFFGSDAIALPLLDWLHTRGGAGRPFVLSGVVSQPDRKSGRGQKLQPNPISAYALEAGIPLLRPDKPDAALEAWLQAEDIRLALVMAYGHILKKSLLASVPLGFVNFHASLLPAYRGASPVESAVASGDALTGVSLMRIAPRMDAGPVLATETVAIDHARAETGADIRHKLAAACVPLIDHNIDALLSGAAEARFIPQDETLATYCRKLDKSDGQLDFHAPATALAARINGLFPWPGCYLDYLGERFKVAEAFALPAFPAQPPLYAASPTVPTPASQPNTPATLPTPVATPTVDSTPASQPANAALPLPGTILSADKTGLYIATGAGVLRILRLQKAGGKLLPVQEFIAGTPLQAGACVQGGAMRPLLSPTPRASA